MGCFRAGGASPWCFTEDPDVLADYCAIPICGVSDYLNAQYLKQIGTSYIKLLPWKIAKSIELIFYPILLFCGSVSNILSVMVFSLPCLKKVYNIISINYFGHC